MFDTLAAQLGAVFVVIVCAFAFLKGDETERYGGGAYVLGWFASLLVQSSDIYDTSPALFAVDAAMLGVLVALTWKSRRAWPTWASALQLLIVMSHIVIFVDVRPPANSFVTVINLAGYGVLLSLAIGTFWAWQDRRAAGLE